MGKWQSFLLVTIIGAIIWFIPVPAGLKPQAWHLLAIFVATIIGIILNLVLPKESEGLALDAPEFTGELAEEAAEG